MPPQILHLPLYASISPRRGLNRAARTRSLVSRAVVESFDLNVHSLVLRVVPSHQTFADIANALSRDIPTATRQEIAANCGIVLEGNGNDDVTAEVLNSILAAFPDMRKYVELRNLSLPFYGWRNRRMVAQRVALLLLTDVIVGQGNDLQTGFNNVYSMFSVSYTVLVRSENGPLPSVIRTRVPFTIEPLVFAGALPSSPHSTIIGTDEQLKVAVKNRRVVDPHVIQATTNLVVEDVSYSRAILASLWGCIFAVRGLRVALRPDNLSLVAQCLFERKDFLEDLALEVIPSRLSIDDVRQSTTAILGALKVRIEGLTKLRTFTVCVPAYSIEPTDTPENQQVMHECNLMYWSLTVDLIIALRGIRDMHQVTVEFVCRTSTMVPYTQLYAGQWDRLITALMGVRAQSRVITASNSVFPSIGLSSASYQFIAHRIQALNCPPNAIRLEPEQ